GSEYLFQAASGNHQDMWAIRNQSADGVASIEQAIRWPRSPSAPWERGFLAGLFDAEGSYSGGILRIHNTDPQIIAAVTTALRRFGFRWAVETRPGANRPVTVVRLLGGLVEHLRFFHTVD